MGDRGRVLHVRSAAGASLLEAAGVRHEVLAKNRRWTSFAPLGKVEPDPDALAARCAVAVAQVWFDEDSGVSIHIAGDVSGELFFPLGERGLGEADVSLLRGCVKGRLLTAAAAREIQQRAGRSRGRDAWILRHGVEELFGFPFTGSVPVTTTATAATVPPPPAPTTARTWSPEERRVVDLHVHYWTRVWSMNVWSLYNRYKKHLPAAARGDVDRLCDAVACGRDGEIQERVESILARTWAAEDWGAFVRSPKHDDDGAEAQELARWRQMTGR